MPSHPWPTRVHPFLVELTDQMCQKYAIPQVRLARPYFGYRSDQEQAALYAQGRQPLYEVNLQRVRAGLTPISESENKNTVTNARPGASKHNADPSRAVDLVVVSLVKGVQYVWDEGADLDHNGVAEYMELGVIGEGLGLVWGGRFDLDPGIRVKPDWGHFQLPEEGSKGLLAIIEKLAPDPAKAHGLEYAA